MFPLSLLKIFDFTRQAVPDLEIVYKTVKSRGTKVELISFAKISTSFAEARQSRKAMQADDGEECHEKLRRMGLLESHGLSETPIVWGNTSL